MAERFKPPKDEIITDPTERFIVKVNDFKHSMGLWYSLIGQRILPFLLFIIPVNVIMGRVDKFIYRFYSVNLNVAFLYAMWITIMLAFLAVTIFAPKAASVIEFVFGITYLVLAFHYHMFHNALGYALLFSVILFLLVKLVFLVFKIIQLRAFADDKKNNIERDASGRVVHAVNDEVFFTEEDNAEEQRAVVASDDDVYYTEENVSEYESASVASDDNVYYTEENLSEYESATDASNEDVYYMDEYEVEEESATSASNDEVYFVSEDNEDESPMPVTEDEVFFAETEVDESEPIVQTDDQLVFASDDNYDRDEELISQPDNDFFFG